MARGYGSDFSDVPSRPTAVGMYPWLLLAASAASDTAAGRLQPAWLAGGGLAGFAVLYTAAIWVRWRSARTGTACLLLAALAAVTLGLNLGFRSDMSALFPSCAGPGRSWPGRRWTPSGCGSPATCTTCSGTPSR